MNECTIGNLLLVHIQAKENSYIPTFMLVELKCYTNGENSGRGSQM